MNRLKATATYFGLVFAAGVFLGPIRESWAVPRFGEAGGVLAEAVPMLAIMFFAARWIVYRFELPDVLRERLTIGLWALGLLAIAEVAGAMFLRGQSPGAYAAHLITPPGLVSLVLFAAFALMPALVRKG